jgi:hypothetical protein
MPDFVEKRHKAICRCPRRSKRAILAVNPLESGECRFERRPVPAAGFGDGYRGEARRM